MTEKTNDYLLSSKLYTTEAEESKKRVEVEKKIKDPDKDVIDKIFEEAKND